MKNKYRKIYGLDLSETFDFRLLDDDGVVYAYGKNTKESFGPLDKYGSDFGCTDIQYKNKRTGEWESL